MVAQSLDARRLVFVDEMGANISLSPLYAWAVKGRRARCSVPRNRGSNTTMLSSMTLEGALHQKSGPDARNGSSIVNKPPLLVVACNLCASSLEGMRPSLIMEGATTSVVFETYVEQVLVPTLRRGQMVVMDNLSAHKGERVRELIEGRGCELL